MEPTTLDRLATDESAAGSRGHRPGVVRVGIVKIAAARIQHVDVADRGVANVDVVYEAAARAEAGIIRFTEAEREPTDAEASAKSASETSSA